MFPKFIALIAGGGSIYGLSFKLTKPQDRIKGPYVIIRLGEYQKQHKMFVFGERIFLDAGKWLEWKDLTFVIDGQKLSGDYRLSWTKKQSQSNGEICLKKGNQSKWCWDQISNADREEWPLEQLLFKFNFEDVSYFPEGGWDNLQYKIHLNKKGTNGCNISSTSGCTSNSQPFDVIGGEII